MISKVNMTFEIVDTNASMKDFIDLLRKPHSVASVKIVDTMAR